MTPNFMFVAATLIVLSAWLLLALAPASQWTQRVVHALWIPALLAFPYTWALLHVSWSVWDLVTLEAAMKLFQDRYAVLCAWIHILSFDLFAGAWESRDARRRGIPHFLLLPCLGLTLLLAPIGLLAYLALRWLHARGRPLEQSA